jgi:gliding motility-associated-like protein
MVFGSDLYYAEISTLTLNNLSSGANQYLWEFGNGDTSSLFEPNYNYNLAGNYTITLNVTNQYGCSDFSSQVIEVIAPEHLYVPNAFSPNNDNINDYFSSGNWNIEDLTIAIYNRWGDAIYTAGGSNFRWDGTYKGKPVPEGVYVYKIAARGIRGEEFNKMGTVTLIR